MASKFRKLLSLPRAELRAIAVASLALPFARLALAIAGVRFAQRLFTADAARARKRSTVELQEVQARTCDAVRIASARLWRDGCLPRAVVLRWLLQRQGIDARLRIGAKVVERELSAHAWVEVDGHPLNEPANVAAASAVFDDIGSPSASR